MKIIITGGTGYLGSCLVKRFISLGHEVACIVRDLTNLKHLSEIANKVQLIPVINLEQSLNQFHADCIVHAACAYSRNGNTEHDIFNSNLLFPFQVMQAAMEAGVKTWFNVGTSLPSMLNSYALSKGQLIEWGKFYAEAQKLQFINFRLEHFYGLNAPHDQFLPWVVQKLRKNESIELTEGTQRRDFIYIEDVAAIIEAALKYIWVESYVELPIGTGIAPTIREVVEYLKEILQSRSILCFGAIAVRKDEPNSCCDISALRALKCCEPLHWKEGLSRVYGS